MPARSPDPSTPRVKAPKQEPPSDASTPARIDPDEVLKDLDVHPETPDRGSALTDVLTPGGTREDDDHDRTGFVKPHRFQHT